MVLFGNNKNSDELYEEGEQLYVEGKYEESLKCFDEAITIEPSNSDYWASKSSALFSIGKNDDALDCVNESIRLNPDNLSALNNKAGILYHLGKISEAISYYDKIIKIDSTYADAYSSKASVLVMSINEANSYQSASDRYDEAIKCFDIAINLNPSHLEYKEDKQKALFVIEQFKQSDSSFNKIRNTWQGNLMESDLNDNFAMFSWQQAEDLVGKLFEKKGYAVTIGVPTLDGGTKRQGDFGIDVEAKNETEYLGIQVKHWSLDVGFEDVAKTLGVAQKFNKVIIISTKSGFTSQAWEHAQNNPYLIELWDSNKFKNELRQHVISSTKIQKSKGALPKDST